jgi:hypothetical protein
VIGTAVLSVDGFLLACGSTAVVQSEEVRMSGVRCGFLGEPNAQVRSAEIKGLNTEQCTTNMVRDVPVVITENDIDAYFLNPLYLF